MRASELRSKTFPSVKTGENGVVSFRILNFMTNKIIHDDRNGHITSNFYSFDAMISSLAKVMGLQSRQKKGPKFVLQEHSSRHGKVIQHDRNDNISHTTY